MGQSASLATNLDGPNNRTPTIWGSKCPLGSIFRWTNEEIEGLCPPGAGPASVIPSSVLEGLVCGQL